jgi:lysozyme family protein
MDLHFFDIAIARVLDHEGGFTANPLDRGNWTSGTIGKGVLKGTKYGISAMSYPNLDIKNLTWEDAKAIYKRDFWNPINGDKLHCGVSYQLLDFAINSGVGAAVKAYQRALGVKDDGQFGPASLAAAAKMSVNDQILNVIAERLEYMVKATSWLTFSKGWVKRIAANLRVGALDNGS